MANESSSSSPPRRRVSGWRFSLGSILLAMTLLSLGLGVFRVVPMSPEMRAAMFWLAGFWAITALVWLGPGWLHYLRLQRDIDERKAELQRWADEHRARHASPPDSTTENKLPSA